MAERTDHLEREVLACRNNLDTHLGQLQARAEEKREEAKDHFRRTSWIVLVAGATACGYSLFKLAKQRRSASRWDVLRRALLNPRA